MLERIFDSLQLPEKCVRHDKTLFKKLFDDNGELTARDKKLFQEQIDKIVLHYNLNPRNSNILAFQNEERRYLELPIISVSLKGRKGAARIAEIIQRTLPHPCLLVLCADNAVTLHVAHQRIHGSDTTKITLEATEQSPWLVETELTAHQQAFLQALDSRQFRFTNLYDFYSDLFQRVQALNVAEISGRFNEGRGHTKQVEGTASRLNHYRSLESRVEGHRNALKAEPHFNRKTELKLKIQQLKAEMVTLAAQL